MKLLKIFAAALISAFVFSCATSPKTPEKQTTPEPTVPVVVEKTPLEKFNSVWEGVRISVIDAPKEIVNGKEFSSPYVAKASKNDGTPCSGFEIEVSYPVSRIGEDVSFEKTILKTDENGTVSFTASKPDRPYHSEVSFAPVFKDSKIDEKVKAEIEKKTVKAPYRVKTNMTMAGGSIALVDFNASGDPITSNTVTSSNLLIALMNKGFKGIGNADFTTAIASGDEKRIYNEAKSFFGNNVAFLVFGTAKYVSPVSKEGDIFTCTLKGEITAYNMKTGALLTKAVREVTASEKTEWNCLPAARKLLAEELCEAIVYGL